MTNQESSGRHWHRLSFWHLLSVVFGVIKKNYKILGALLLVYGAMFFIFAQGISSVDISSLKQDISEDLSIEPDSVGGKLLLAGLIFESSGAQDDAGATFMLIINIIVSLAMIWILRHIWLKKKTNLKEAFYKGMYPLVQYISVLAIGLIQLLPAIIGIYLLGIALQDVLISMPEIVGGYIVLLVLPSAMSLYLLMTTIFALIVVTIPEMTPMEAYRASKDLVKGKRAYVAKHFLLLLLIMTIAIALLLLISIAVLPATAPFIGFVSSVVVMPLLAVFTYTLYRSLVGE